MARKASSSPTGDTPKVNRNVVLLNYQYRAYEKVRDPATGLIRSNGNLQTFRGNVYLKYPEALISYYDIPTYTVPADATFTSKITHVDSFTWTRFNDVNDTTGRQITNPGYDRIVAEGNSSARKRKSAIVALDKVSEKGNPRTVSFAFPDWFTVLMIAQSLGSMIKTTNTDRKPVIFTMKGSGASYNIPYNSSTAPLTGAESGAWLATAPITAAGGETQRGDEQVISTAGDMDATDNTTTP